ncbi:MAG TPA: hypothetical protein VFU50_18715 [Terriglobales bacterium]|nr:hypothetical protein [Terriglobales bacterium]
MNTRYATSWSVLAAVSVAAKYAVAQGCASCYTTAAAGGAQTVHALRNGIVVLLVPPALMFVGLMIVVRRWRTSADANPRVPDRNGSVDFDSSS